MRTLCAKKSKSVTASPNPEGKVPPRTEAQSFRTRCVCRSGGDSAAGQRIAPVKMSSFDITERSMVTEIRKAGENFYLRHSRDHVPLPRLRLIRNSLDLVQVSELTSVSDACTKGTL